MQIKIKDKMKVTTFLFENKGEYIKLKSFFDVSVLQTSSFAYIDKETKETVPAEVHTIYLITSTGVFANVAYGYTRKRNLKLLEAYPDCLNGHIEISGQTLKELIKPKYKLINNKTFQEGFILSNEFKGCEVYGLDYFQPKEPRKKWAYNTNRDEVIMSKINPIEITKN